MSSILLLLMVLLMILAGLGIKQVDEKDDPHYREIYKQVRNANLAILLKEDLKSDDYSLAHTEALEIYHNLVSETFRKVGFNQFDYSCSYRPSIKRIHRVSQVTLMEVLFYRSV